MSDHGDTYPDRLSLLGLLFEGRHGALPGERDQPQPFEVDVVLHASLAAAAESDELADTADYGPIAEIARRVVEGPGANLIETLAGRIAGGVLDATDPAVVGAVEVTVRKPEAPIEAEVETVAVTFVRRRA